MEKLTLNFGHKQTILRDQLISLILKSWILVLLVGATNFRSFGQAPVEYNSMLTQMTESGDSALVQEAAYIKSLVTDKQPTVYINDVVKASGSSAPLRADVKAGSVSKLSIENTLFQQVELITLRIDSPEDLSTVLDLSLIQGFTNLKYIRILCSFECSAEQLSTIVTGNSSGIKVFYSVSIPS